MKIYERYKDSGIEWIGGIPEHWEVSRLKFVGESIIGLTYSPEEVTEDESGYLVLRSSNIQSGKLSLDDNVFVKKQINEKLITRKNDILICARNGSVDLVGKNILIDERTAGQTFGAFMTVFRGRSNQFVYWFFNSPFFDAQKGAFSTSTINQLTSNILNNLITTIPPLSEQTAIANYLDTKTTEIDQIVADKEALINLYEEEKKALINEAVTKGVPNSSPFGGGREGALKPSGVEWLGNVPEHWKVNKFGRVAFFQEGPGLRHWQFADEGIKVICVTNIVPPKIDFSNYTKYISIEEYQNTYRHFTVSKGDILLASSGASWGKVSEYLDDEAVILNTSTIRLNANSQGIVIKEFIKWLIQCAYISEHLTLLLTGSCQPNFGPTHLNQLVCAYPVDIAEQTYIVQYIERETANINDKINQIKQEIALLKEYRQALIFEAVTGKICVH